MPNNTYVTITSREVTEMTGKRHSNTFYVGELNYRASLIRIYENVCGQLPASSKIVWQGSDEEFNEYIGSFNDYLLMKLKSIMK